ncbi:hypothetical protein Pfo_027721 [Paulownia fortunei]|nr:hypothetical protein Pfo_027721 [Paulownia fortunei]
MAKVAFTMLLLLQIVCATYAAAASDAQLEAACKRTSHVKFCVNLLQPYASQFEDNDPDKMGYAAISATLAQAQAARAFMVRQSTDTEASAAERAALKHCLDKVGDSVDSLHQAAREFDEMRGTKDEQREYHRKKVINRINSSSNDQNACSDLFKKNRKKVGDEIAAAVRRQAAEAAQASFVAQAFIQ